MQVISGEYCEKHEIEKTYWHRRPNRPSGGSWECRICQRETNEAARRRQGIKKISGQYCEKHGVEKTFWHKHPNNPSGGSWECRLCNRETNARNGNNPRAKELQRLRIERSIGAKESNWRRAGITDLTYARWQSEVKYCRICGRTEDLVADHDHTTKSFRGVLCRRCNAGLGQFGDNTVLLRCAELYLGGQPCH